ncbi:MAG: hypothetical protein JSW00_13740 [Thermoplasmata archaeon]|nr:MAG: hypothetical protein JSW00_13740 [Thermoplasmata archaeon]
MGSLLQAKAEKIDKHLKKKGATGQNYAKHVGMIESVDENIGRILDALESLNLTKKTIVFSSACAEFYSFIFSFSRKYPRGEIVDIIQQHIIIEILGFCG